MEHTMPLVDPERARSDDGSLVAKPPPPSILVRLLWILPLVTPLVLLGGGIVYVLRQDLSSTYAQDGSERLAPDACVGCKPSLMGCAIATSFTTESALEGRLARLLGIFPARVRVTQTSSCDASPMAEGSKAIALSLEVFDQEDTDGPLWRTGRELCTALRPRRGGFGAFDLAMKAVYTVVPWSVPCSEPWNLSTEQLAKLESSGAVSGLESVVLQHEDALDSMGDGDTHLSVPLFVLLLSFTLADLGRLLLRRWRARGATARLVRLAAYAIEEEQVRDAASLYVVDHGGGQRAGGGGEKSGRPRDGERAADGGPLRLLNGATETHFLLRIVLMPLVLLLSLTIFPFFPSTVGVRVALSVLFTTTPGPARLRHHRKMLTQVWAIAALVVGPFVLFVLASTHPAVCRRITWYGMAWYGLGTCAMAGALCIGAPEAKARGAKDAHGADAASNVDVERSSFGPSIGADAAGWATADPAASMSAFDEAHRQLVALSVGVTKYHDDETCEWKLRHVVTGKRFFWINAIVVLGAHVAVLVIFGPRLLGAWRVSAVHVRFQHVEKYFVLAAALPFVPTLVWWLVCKMHPLLHPMLSVFQRHAVDLWDAPVDETGAPLRDLQTADVKLACRGLEAFMTKQVNRELTAHHMRDQLVGLRPAPRLPPPDAVPQLPPPASAPATAETAKAKAPKEEVKYAREVTGMTCSEWFERNWELLVDEALAAVDKSVENAPDETRAVRAEAPTNRDEIKNTMFEMMKELLNDMSTREAFNELLVLYYLVTGQVAGEAVPDKKADGKADGKVDGKPPPPLYWDHAKMIFTREPKGAQLVDNRAGGNRPFDFFTHIEARKAKVHICHVLALRIYTSPLGPNAINAGLRNFDAVHLEQSAGEFVLKEAHKLQTTVKMLDEGIRQLRINSIDRVPTLVRGASGRESVKAATVKELLMGNEDHDEEAGAHSPFERCGKMMGRIVGAEDDQVRTVTVSPGGSVARKRTLWRGMSRVSLPERFLEKGGVCTPPMSTSHSLEEALRYATNKGQLANDAVIFQIEITDATNPLLGGAPVEFVSVFPNEQEELFPPLTLLRPLPHNEADEDEDDGEYPHVSGLLGARQGVCTVHVGDLSLVVVKMYPTTGGSKG